jgi:hypothetical protein
METCLPPPPPEPQLLDLDLLDRELDLAVAVTAGLFRKVTESGACPRLFSLRQSGSATELDRLIEAGAWTDATITLLGFELPNWGVRRLQCEDGEWLCSLSRQPHLPTFLDEPAERSHAVLPLAVLRAFLAARRWSAATRRVKASVPQVQPRPAFVFCCDNLA